MDKGEIKRGLHQGSDALCESSQDERHKSGLETTRDSHGQIGYYYHSGCSDTRGKRHKSVLRLVRK